MLKLIEWRYQLDKWFWVEHPYGWMMEGAIVAAALFILWHSWRKQVLSVVTPSPIPAQQVGYTTPVTAGEIVERKKSKPFKLHKSSAQLRAEFEAKHNTKEQKHQKLVQEIEQCL